MNAGPVGDLSGGEQSRVLIARLMLQPADLLILDEPTNDLDIASLEVLEESLSEFSGALVLVTHDRFMLDRIATELLALDGKGGLGLATAILIAVASNNMMNACYALLFGGVRACLRPALVLFILGLAGLGVALLYGHATG